MSIFEFAYVHAVIRWQCYLQCTNVLCKHTDESGG